ncbi:MAG: Rrf2 family transcriptional regulator, partial [Bryobacterales bacterium]|nr:Rrf2 family transcriptional regulator [Bryobacterales bacterium]
MKLSAQEEYGLRCLIHMARVGQEGSLSIPEISRAEGLSVPNVAKLMRLLRIGGFVVSVRGQAGGYTLSRPPEQITVGSVLDVLGGRFYNTHFCERHSGLEDACAHSTDCAVRSLWASVQELLDSVLTRTTLKDLLCREHEMRQWIESRSGTLFPVIPRMAETPAPVPPAA